MKLDKIRMIEQPNEEIFLSTEAMEYLLGGVDCTNFDSHYCGEYRNGADCSSPSTTRCTKYCFSKT